MERLCLDCGHPLQGRSDKKFCDDACRSNFNNRLKSTDYLLLKQINSILKRNRDILSKFNPDQKAKVSKQKLSAAGFDFNYHTHYYQTKNGHQYIFCYEYGYLNLADEHLLIVKRDE